MRFFPVLTALLVILALYLLLFQRDAVFRFAGVEPAPAATADAEGQADTGAGAQATAEPDAGISVIAINSRAQEIDSAVIVNGRTEASRRVAVRAETSGQVISPPRAKGSWVEQGDVLCQLDPGARTASLNEARARLAEARARLDEAQANYDDTLKLNESGYASEQRLINARATLEAARAGVQSAQARVTSAQIAIEKLTITAPFAGLLESDAAELGSLLQPGAPCATLVQLDPLKLVGFVPELDVARVRLGVQAGGRLGTGRDLVGTVSYLARVSDPLTRTFRVEIDVANPDNSISDGLTVRMLIPSEGRMAHLLPQSALTLDDDGTLGVRVVTQDAQGRDVARFAPVEMIRDALEGVWVAGLPDPAAVIVSGQNYVTDGVLLDVTWKEPGT